MRQTTPSRSRRENLPLGAEHLAQRSLTLPELIPVIPVRKPSRHPHLNRSRLGTFDRRARHGDLVRLELTAGETFGYGLFNPRAEVSVRVLTHGETVPDEAWWLARLQAACELRTRCLQLDRTTNAYRIVHGEADGLPGLIVDRYADILSIEVFSLAIYQRIDALLQLLVQVTGCQRYVVRCGPQTAEQEGLSAEPFASVDRPRAVEITESDVRYRVDFSTGHKTGFFCDQRDNRRRVAELSSGASMLDLCCYTGGFGLSALKSGGARDVTGVDLDERAIQLARSNAKLNGVKARYVHADAFAYIRDMDRNERSFDFVVLDPPKLILSRAEAEIGRRKYYDLNRLAMRLVAPGGWLLTCTCSGLMSSTEFRSTVAAAIPGDRTARILFATGAGPDHPIAPHFPQSEYLQALWLRFD